MEKITNGRFCYCVRLLADSALTTCLVAGRLVRSFVGWLTVLDILLSNEAIDNVKLVAGFVFFFCFCIIIIVAVGDTTDTQCRLCHFDRACGYISSD